MPIPKPETTETKDDFIARCMENDQMQEYDVQQRMAICLYSYSIKD
jgi:hypothetical protein